MIYFFNRYLELLEYKNEISFNFSKRANKEGSGKIELSELPHKESVYISIYETSSQSPNVIKNDFSKYITSGFIADIEIGIKNVVISFNTFEGLLKNNKLPKPFSNFEGMTQLEVFSNLFYAFTPIIKSKKKDFINICDGYNVNANFAQGVLSADHISFAKIKDGDLHLSFDKTYKEKNSFRYETTGAIIFWFDLGAPCEYRNYITSKKEKYYNDNYAKRYLRFTASLGTKTIINVKAIEQDNPFIQSDISTYKKSFNNAPYLPFNRGVKDFEKNVGVELPSSKRFLAIQFIFIYEKPDFIQDFKTLEVYDDEGKLQKRTVRGFTPVLHGFEILNRRAIAPFSFMKHTRKYIYENVMENEFFSASNSKIKFDGLSLYEALTKFLEATKQNLEIRLLFDRKNKHIFLVVLVSQYDFNLERIEKNVPKYIDEKHVLRLHEKDASRLNNYVLKTIKKKTQFPKMIHYYGAGDGQDVLYICLFNEVIQNPDNSLKEILKLYSPTKIKEKDEKNNYTIEGQLLKDLEITQTQFLPNTSFIEHEIRDSNIQNFNELLIKAKNYFIEENKKENCFFEIDSNLNINLYDRVLLIYQKNKLYLEANIVEIKISEKDSKLQKTFGIGGFLFNPFDCLFQKPQVTQVIKTPLPPFNVRAFTENKHLKVAWDCLGVNDGYVIEVSRLDGNIFSRERGEQKAFFYSVNNEIDLSSFEEKIIYCLSIYSYIGNIKSAASIPIYFKINNEIMPIRILHSLNEIGTEEGEHGFYLDIEYRNNSAIQKELCYILGLSVQQGIKRLREANDETEGLFDNIRNNGFDEQQEKVLKFLGLEYVWLKGEWVDVRFRLPRFAPTFYFDFKSENVSKNYSSRIFKLLKSFFENLKEYEKARQLLNYLQTHYQLPEPENYGSHFYSLNDEAFPAPNRPPIDEPIFPGPLPPKPLPPDPIPPDPKPPKPPKDKRIVPNKKIKELWDKNIDIYAQKQSKLGLFISMINNSNIPIDGKIFNLSPFGNNMEFNTPLFDILKNQTRILEGGFPRGGEFLGSALNFIWQSTITNGDFSWEKDKPFFRIKEFSKDSFYKPNSTQNEHTFGFWLYVYSVKGRFELWNIRNYNIGLIQDGFLHFCCKKTDGSYFTFYKIKLKEQDITNNIYGNLKSYYYHIMVIANYNCLYIMGNPRANITQKIYINFKEILPNEYEEKKRTLLLDLDIANYENDFSLFNFKDLKKEEENYLEYVEPNSESEIQAPYIKSTFFDVSLSHIILFNFSLDYGERQFLKRCITYPTKEEKKEENKIIQKVTQGKLTENSKYKGVCVSSVNPNKNNVNIYEKGELQFNIDDFFLMGKNEGDFKAGTLYAWTGYSWHGLTPYSLYHKEYVIAYSDIVKMKDLVSDIFFKDFLINTLQISDILYSKTIQTNSLTIQKGLFLNDLKNVNPNVEGQVYQRNGRLFICLG